MERPDRITTFSNTAENVLNSTHFKFKGIRNLEKDKLSIGYEYIINNTLLFINVDEFMPFDVNLEGTQHAFFGSYETMFAKDLHLRFGLRGTYYNLDDNVYLSPRLDLNYKVTENFYLKAALSRYYQFTQTISYENRLSRTFDLWIVNNAETYPIQRSDHQMIGFRWLNEFLDIDVEVYRKNTFGFLQFSAGNIGFNDNGRPVINTEYFRFVGNNLTQGIDFTIKKSIKNYTGWIAYTLSLIHI